MEAVFVRNPYNYDRDAASVDSGLECLDDSMTQQQFKDDADINVIVRRFGITGELPVGVRMPTYGDFDLVNDYQSALEAMREAEASFMAMPANVRERFANDPQKFLDFCADSRNIEEARKLGLVPAAEVPPVVKSEVADV